MLPTERHPLSCQPSGDEDSERVFVTEETFGEQEEDEARDTVSDDLPSMLPVPTSRGRRVSVSAESIQPSLHLNREDYPKHPKSEAQRESILNAISQNFLFRTLDDDQRDTVIDAMEEKRVPADTVVIEQGAEGDFFYIVESGTLDCFIDDKKVTSYEAGGSFGELALMYGAPRAATIKTTSEAVLCALDRITFRSILMDSTASKRRMYEQFLSDVPILRSLNTNERHKVADALEPVQYEDKEVVIKEGDVGTNFYLIEDGVAVFFKTGPDGKPQEVNRASKGDYFGELALLHDEPRAATVVAEGRLKCITLGKNAFTRLLGPVMDILKRNSENYHAVLQEAGQNK
ncbi:cAMP dependent protein kinase regulatory subunit [Syncephalastrum racemosum]|uniref:cAMP-dependent protein kinase regulatory subunit n=1 Tax=Syncephalastrum racemosum TaxID=13706 RepID=A0A1X2H1C3_SYNRA|nr:cAMP dependent protein kinase regulatory subunit [Syncephalastrum racemosum]